MKTYTEPSKTIPVRTYDVVVVGGGTAGLTAAVAAARNGARTALVESKGYIGGTVVEGGTALHSYYNLWKAFPGVEKRQVVRGIAQEIIDRLAEMGGTTGHVEQEIGFDYDSVCTIVDTELYKLAAFELLADAGVDILVNTLFCDAIVEGTKIRGIVTESKSGREALMASCFVDTSGYGDLAARAGARYTEPRDHNVANSIGVGGVDVERYRAFLEEHGALGELALADRDGKPGQTVRVSDRGLRDNLPQDFFGRLKEIGMNLVTTTIRDDYFLFIKVNYAPTGYLTDRDEINRAEIELRRRQLKAIQLMRAEIPGCENAFISRTAPSMNIRRARCIECDYDITLDDVVDARHFEDDVMTYGFHDMAPTIQIRDGGTYGIPFRALRVAGLDNLLAAGMNITSDFKAHMSTRNTVCCMGQGQAAGTAAALCATNECGTRELPYSLLRKTLMEQDVYLEDQ